MLRKYAEAHFSTYGVVGVADVNFQHRVPVSQPSYPGAHGSNGGLLPRALSPDADLEWLQRRGFFGHLLGSRFGDNGAEAITDDQWPYTAIFLGQRDQFDPAKVGLHLLRKVAAQSEVRYGHYGDLPHLRPPLPHRF